MYNSITPIDEKERLDTLFDVLFPINRSITGTGLLESLKILQQVIPLNIESEKSGTQIFDWEVPKEWVIRDAFLIGPNGDVIANYKESNLSVVNYSVPVDQTLSLSELRNYLFTNPDLPHSIPYVTSYYSTKWGFCIPHNVYSHLSEGKYRAIIDSELIDGRLHYGHYILKGETEKEIMLTSYLCHPSMANNELSGPLVLSALYNRLKRWKNRYYTYRFVIAPETIGSLVYLNKYGDDLKKRVVSGMVLTCLGGPQKKLSYKKSKSGSSFLDDLISNLCVHTNGVVETRPFTPINGSDERQYCSPGFNLPMGQIARTVYGEYPGYHNSSDDKDFMTIDSLISSIDEIEKILRMLEYAGPYENLKPFGEPMLSKYDLYPTINAPSTQNDSSDYTVKDKRSMLNTILEVLAYSFGGRSMVDIATQINQPIFKLMPIIDVLIEKELLQKRDE